MGLSLNSPSLPLEKADSASVLVSLGAHWAFLFALETTRLLCFSLGLLPDLSQVREARIQDLAHLLLLLLLIFTVVKQSRHYGLHFTVEETEAQKVK